mgnify:FL=1
MEFEVEKRQGRLLVVSDNVSSMSQDFLVGDDLFGVATNCPRIHLLQIVN